MPRRSILSAAERECLLALPETKDELIRHYTFSESDLSIIRQRRGPANRLGFAVQLCYLRFPGIILGVGEPPFPLLLKLVAKQLNPCLTPYKISSFVTDSCDTKNRRVALQTRFWG